MFGPVVSAAGKSPAEFASIPTVASFATANLSESLPAMGEATTCMRGCISKT